MQYKTLLQLPKKVKQILDKKIKTHDLNALKAIFNMVKAGGSFGFNYSMDSSYNYSNSKLPKELWKPKSGHCFELAYFLLACLKYKGFNAQYCEADLKEGDHASVRVKINRKYLYLDPAWAIFIKHKKIRPLNDNQLIGNHYINCASMFYHWNVPLKQKIPLKKQIFFSKKSIKYAKLGLKYDKNSKRAKTLIKLNQNFLDSIKLL